MTGGSRSEDEGEERRRVSGRRGNGLSCVEEKPIPRDEFTCPARRERDASTQALECHRPLGLVVGSACPSLRSRWIALKRSVFASAIVPAPAVSPEPRLRWFPGCALPLNTVPF